jgi:hypothetical protein
MCRGLASCTGVSSFEARTRRTPESYSHPGRRRRAMSRENRQGYLRGQADARAKGHVRPPFLGLWRSFQGPGLVSDGIRPVRTARTPLFSNRQGAGRGDARPVPPSRARAWRRCSGLRRRAPRTATGRRRHPGLSPSHKRRHRSAARRWRLRSPRACRLCRAAWRRRACALDPDRPWSREFRFRPGRA